MGLNTKWIVVKGMPKARVLDALGVMETGEIEGLEVADMAVADLENGWVAVHWGDFGEWTPERVAAWFPRGEVLFGSTYDVVSFSIAQGMCDGKLTWSVKSHPAEAPGLLTQGKLPREFDAVRASLQRQQDEEDPDVERVSYLAGAPAELVRAITSYDPWRSCLDGREFRVVEPRLTGVAGEEQTDLRILSERMAQAIESEVIPAMRALGFEPYNGVAIAPDIPNGSRTLVRVRDGRSEMLEVFGQPPDDRASIGFKFFVGGPPEFRGGQSGRAQTPEPKRGFLEMFIGPASLETDDEARARAVREALELLPHVDRHLKEGILHPHIRPATYSGGRKA